MLHIILYIYVTPVCVTHKIRWFTFYNMTKPKHQLQKRPLYASDSRKVKKFFGKFKLHLKEHD